MNKQKNTKKGFTLMEMLVVVLIIGILAGIALPQYTNAKIKSDFAEAYIKLKAAAQIEEMCRLQNGVDVCTYPKVGYNYMPFIVQVNTEINGCKELNEYGNCNDFDWDKNKFMIYMGSSMSGSNDLLAHAQYIRENVCMCITKDYKFVLTQYSDDVDCGAKAEASKDYSKILGVPDVTEIDGSRCWCC